MQRSGSQTAMRMTSSWVCRPESFRDSTMEGWNRTKNWHYQWASRGFCCRWSCVEQHHFKYSDPSVLMLPESWPSGDGAGDLAKGAKRLVSIFSQFASNSKSLTVSFQCRDEGFFPPQSQLDMYESILISRILVWIIMQIIFDFFCVFIYSCSSYVNISCG